MTGLSIGFFTPRLIVKDPAAFCRRARETATPWSRAFPLSVQPLKNGAGRTIASIAVVGGAVPIHIDQPNPDEITSSIFQFIIEAENRPCLLCSPADQRTSEAILLPDLKSRFAMGAVEMLEGRVIHFDIATNFHGVIGMPTGDAEPQEPSAVIIQVPVAERSAIQYGLSLAKDALKADSRFDDLVAR